jgi:HD-GYP domain-containing protein (c-di-GMP phosphodiesterase class II)
MTQPDSTAKGVRTPGASTHGQLQPTLVVLEGLLDTLTDTTSSSQALRATVETTRQAVGADLAFWHSKGGLKATALSGTGPMSVEQCTQFARKLLSAIPSGRDVFRWGNPERPTADTPAAALVARTARSGGGVVALKFTPGDRFDSGDEEVARTALRMLIGFRAHAQTATKELLNGLIHSLTAVLDAKDPYTAGHSERVARIAALLGKQLGLSVPMTGDLFLAGLIHDIGKIGIRDEVLWKPGKLTVAEFEEVEQHPVIGERIVASIEPFRRLCPAVRNHHERYDGKGYPDGLAGEAIPVLARVLGVADALDAMMSPRRYRPARSPVEIDAVMIQETGKQFDPVVVAAFMAVRTQIYPPIYQKGIGESAYHAIETMVENQTETSIPVPSVPK